MDGVLHIGKTRILYTRGCVENCRDPAQAFCQEAFAKSSSQGNAKHINRMLADEDFRVLNSRGSSLQAPTPTSLAVWGLHQPLDFDSMQKPVARPSAANKK